MKDQHINTDTKVKNDGVKRMPHELSLIHI